MYSHPFVSQYFKNKTTKEKFKCVECISNGYVLAPFEENTGIAYGNSESKTFVTEHDFSEKFESPKFELKIDDKEEKVTVSLLKSILSQLKNHGIEENAVNELEGCSVDLCREVVVNPKFDLKRAVSQDELFDVELGETVLSFLSHLVPIIKTSLIKLRSKE